MYGNMSKEDYMSSVDLDPDFAKMGIVSLLYKRGDMKRALAISEELPPDRKNDLWRILTHP